MSRPLSIVFPIIIAGLSLSFAACSTPYSRMYSPRNSHFIPKQEKKEKSAEEILTTTEPAPTPGPTTPGLIPDATAPGAIPGLPPATAPAPAPAPAPEAAPAPPL
jgi:hypothetical protein